MSSSALIDYQEASYARLALKYSLWGATWLVQSSLTTAIKHKNAPFIALQQVATVLPLPLALPIELATGLAIRGTDATVFVVDTVFKGVKALLWSST